MGVEVVRLSEAQPEPTVVIVHDYLTQRGGAERVVLSMLKAFPGASLYTSLYEPQATYPEFANYDIRTLWTNRIRLLRDDHRRGLAVYPFAFSQCRLPKVDVVLCSSSGFAHGVRTSARKVVYCYSPPRWLYDEAGTYVARWPSPVRAANRALGGPLRAWDRRAASSATSYLTSSSTVQQRIRATYGIEAELLPPAATGPLGHAEPIAGLLDHPFVLCPSRLLAYKNVGAVVSAFQELPEARLVVVGDGPERRRLEAFAGTNVRFITRVTDGQLLWLYSQCEGLVSAAFEDFGLTPLEAGVLGKPVAVLRAGGFLDTVIDGTTGVFFDEATPGSIASGVRRLLTGEWDPIAIASHAGLYSEQRFAEALRQFVLGTALGSAAAA